MNLYFTAPVINDGSTARAPDVVQGFTGVQSAFDKVPVETDLKRSSVGWCSNNASVPSNTFIMTAKYPPAAYEAGSEWTFITPFANTGPATLNLGLGAKPVLTRAGVALVGGEMNGLVKVVDDGLGNFRMM